MNMWKYLVLAALAPLLAGCVKKQVEPVVVVYPPLIIADATPIVSSTKRSIGVQVNFKNITSNDYSYARFKLTAYNSVGESVKPKKGVRESAYVRLSGPITPGQTKITTWTNTWANKDVQCVSLDEVEIIFMDGSVEVAKDGRLLSEKSGSICI
ncbi:MAG: hypothetical protein MJK10_04675 [Pseudomonadales bacterium]|nr:hypothetical protein [Pseudomonadales bacterium]NRA14995.1 hypothetical protein [Oceanospirillaceae bacterium]